MGDREKTGLSRAIKTATFSLTPAYVSFESDLSGESFPAAPLPVTRTDPTQNPNKFTAKPLQHRSVGASQDEQPQHNPHTSTQLYDSSPHPGRVPEEYGLSEDLAEIVANWDSLPDAIKADILAKVREAVRK